MSNLFSVLKLWRYTFVVLLPRLDLYLWRTSSLHLNKVSFFMNRFPKKPWFYVCSTNRLKTLGVGKGEIARNEQFLLSPPPPPPASVFYPFDELSAIFMKLSSANSFSLEKSKIRVLGKG